MDEKTRQEIVQGLETGSRQAWQALYDANAQRVWREVARLMSGDAGSVADVVQETFMAAARSARTSPPRGGSLAWWLITIARRQVALHYRKRGRSEELKKAVQWWSSLNGQGGQWVTGQASAPEAVLVSSELATLVRHVLATLPDEYQRLLIDKYMDGRSVADLAVRTGATEEAIRSKMARARRAFKDAFENLIRETHTP